MPQKSLILTAALTLTTLLSGCGPNYNQMIEYATLGLQNPAAAENQANMYTVRAEALRAQGHFEAALKDHNAAISLEPTFAFHLQARAETYQAMGRLAEAQADFEKVPGIEAAWQAAYEAQTSP